MLGDDFGMQIVEGRAWSVCGPCVDPATYFWLQDQTE